MYAIQRCQKYRLANQSKEVAAHFVAGFLIMAIGIGFGMNMVSESRNVTMKGTAAKSGGQWQMNHSEEQFVIS
jgi:hypothetical protein